PEQRGQHLVGALATERIQAQLRVVGLAAPVMRILGTVVHQQQNPGVADRVGQQVQQRLRLLVDPMQVLEEDHQRLVERFTEDDPLDRVERPPLANLCIYSSERVLLLLDFTQIFVKAIELLLPLTVGLATLDDTKQREQIREGVIERAIERK